MTPSASERVGGRGEGRHRRCFRGRLRGSRRGGRGGRGAPGNVVQNIPSLHWWKLRLTAHLDSTGPYEKLVVLVQAGGADAEGPDGQLWAARSHARLRHFNRPRQGPHQSFALSQQNANTITLEYLTVCSVASLAL